MYCVAPTLHFILVMPILTQNFNVLLLLLLLLLPLSYCQFHMIEAVCKQMCLNGGVCTSPDTCTCRMGYIGASCERDLDECATGLHACKSSAYCVNMPGWYYCKCRPGYETHNYECHDINECYHGTHSCHPTASCVNYDGHFECVCDNSTDASKTAAEPCRLSKCRIEH